MEIYKATEGKVGTDELLVCSILSQRSDAQIRAIAHTYKQKFTRDLETVIKKVFPILLLSTHLLNDLVLICNP
jgi:annexin A7/11